MPLPTFSAPLPVFLAAVLVPFPVSLATVLVPFSVSFAAVSVPFPVSLSAPLVACPVFLGAVSVSLPAVLAPFSVSLPAVFVASFTSVPVDFVSVLLASCPTANGAAHSKAIMSVTAHFIFMGLLLNFLDICYQKLKYAIFPEPTANRERPSGSRRFVFQRGQRLVIDIPSPQNREYGLGSESRPRQLAEDARGLFLVFGLLQSLLVKIVARLFFFAHALGRRADRLLDHRSVHPARLQLSDHP